MKTTTIALWTLCGMAGLLAGCGGNYYKVNDPAARGSTTPRTSINPRQGPFPSKMKRAAAR